MGKPNIQDLTGNSINTSRDMGILLQTEFLNMVMITVLYQEGISLKIS